MTASWHPLAPHPLIWRPCVFGRSTSQHNDGPGVDMQTLTAINDMVKGYAHDHPRRHVTLQVDEMTILSGLKYRSSDGVLVGFVTQSPFEIHRLSGGDVTTTPPTEASADSKTRHGIVAEQHEQLNDSLASMVRAFVINSVDSTLTMPASTQFVREDTVGKPFDMAGCILRIVADLATVDVHVHLVIADNHICNSVRQCGL